MANKSGKICRRKMRGFIQRYGNDSPKIGNLIFARMQKNWESHQQDPQYMRMGKGHNGVDAPHLLLHIESRQTETREGLEPLYRSAMMEMDEEDGYRVPRMCPTPDCYDYPDEQGVCHTCQTRTIY